MLIQESFFQIITGLLFLLMVMLGGYFRRKADREGGQMRSTEGNRLVMLLRGLGLIVITPLLLYLINPSWVGWAQMSVPTWLRGLGAVLAALMIPCLVWMYRAIGKNVTPTHHTRLNHQLVTTGPYRWIRHPLYTFGFLFFVGLTCLTALWWLGLTMIVPVVILMFRTPLEETRLLETFGDEYRHYMQRTGRFFPKF